MYFLRVDNPFKVTPEDEMERRPLIVAERQRRMQPATNTSPLISMGVNDSDVNPLIVGGTADSFQSTSHPPPSDDTDADVGGSCSSNSSQAVFTTVNSALSSPEADPFRQRLLAALFLANACDAVEVLSIGFILTVYTNGADGAGLTAGQEEVLTAAVFAGMLIGGLASGSVSDRFGRRRALLGALSTNATAAMASALAPNSGVLIACRVVCGLGVGASVPAVFTMASEMFPPQRRGELVTVSY